MHYYNIAMVSDYFHPNTGGIETHILELSRALIKMGHNVIVITHRYNNCKSVEYLGPLKIYYLNIPIFYMNTTFPGFLTNFFLLVDILKSENIEIVHGHQSMSSLSYESLLHAQCLNIKSVFTDHSLFGLDTLENIIVNRISKFILKNIDRVICVSYCLKENLSRRTNIESSVIHVVPNAISDKFKALKKKRGDKIIIVSSCRFVYRKGIDILVKAIPKICNISDKIEFIILGEGPKRDQIEQVIDDHNLENRVTLLGTIKHQKVYRIIQKCDIFLNTSLTESFCIAIIEAAACGLQIVSTNVGAISEVLPPHMITLVNLDENEISNGVKTAIQRLELNSKEVLSRSIKKVYSWERVARETVHIYQSIKPKDNISHIQRFSDRLDREKGLFNIYFRLIIIVEYILVIIYDTFKTKQIPNKTVEEKIK